MPVPRGKKATVSAGSKITLPKLNATTTENQEEGPQVKRSSSPPHGAPKKRTAFIDITNASGPCLSCCRPNGDVSFRNVSGIVFMSNTVVVVTVCGPERKALCRTMV
ncbi:G2/mitotic-specific cyclin-B3-like [Micropterus salmoides]|uniref:G2/mitotic-specific cyclin-B3-like n=1 Tax=Micropterus salmoides TaxID=27706 RepID=UPI0018EB7101|nr:G2/mitotic-specific cyclin-B3-like [Micropterus salmoides]